MRIYKAINPLALFCFGILAIALSGCGSSVSKKHPALQVNADTLTASVYFIRPTPFKSKGIADNPIGVSYKGKRLLTIREGSYTLLKIKPGKGPVTTHSKSMFTKQLQPVDITRTREYTFVAGRTYFIHLTRVDEEFRGIYYDPQPVDLATAKQLSEPLYASGLADDEPIALIKDVPSVPKTSPLEPLYPEQVYPKTPYTLEKPVKQ